MTMFEDLCVECGTPTYITEQQHWLNTGDIVYVRSPDRRMSFLETENLDSLIDGMEEILGISIEHIVMAAFRNSVRGYLEFLLPDNINELVRTGQVDPKAIDQLFADVARVAGNGVYEILEVRYEQDDNDFFTDSITEPYSVPLCAAMHAGGIESIFGYDHEVTYLEATPGVYRLTAYPSEHPEEIERKIYSLVYEHHDGDIELEKCPTCGGPKALSGFTWHLDRGVILDDLTGRRMALLGQSLLSPVFSALEQELGESGPQLIVEAQRRFVRNGFYTMDDVGDEEYFRTWLALRGWGNLCNLEVGSQGLSMKLDNATMHLLIVGMMQGIFDAAFDTDTRVEWEMSEERELELEVKPLASLTYMGDLALPRGGV